MMTAKTDAQGTTNYRWDGRGRLVQATLPGGQAINYNYDALGRRASRTVNNSTTNFLYSGKDVVIDQASDGQQVDYLNGLGVDNKLRQSSAATGVLYFLQDHLGSTAALTNTGGEVVERQEYEPFGDSQGSALTRYGYTGRERDDLTGLVYYRARWYDPQQGRFMSQDPIAHKGGMNLYSYVGNNPLTQVDPFGLRAIKLSRCVKDWLKPFFPDIDLDKVRIHDDGLPWWSKFNTVPGGPGAITFGNDIWFPATGSSRYDPYSAAGIAAIGHELMHVAQFSRLGYAGFIKKYGQSYIDNIKKQLPSGGPGLPPIFPFDGYPLMDTAGIKAVEFIKWMNDVRKWAQKSHPPLDRQGL